MARVSRKELLQRPGQMGSPPHPDVHLEAVEDGPLAGRESDK
jgi:hypothetical protein